MSLREHGIQKSPVSNRKSQEREKMIDKKWKKFGFCYHIHITSPYNKQMPTHPIAIQISKWSLPCVHVTRVCMHVYIVHVWLWVWVWTFVCRGIHVELRGQHSAVGSLLPPWDVRWPGLHSKCFFLLSILQRFKQSKESLSGDWVAQER